MLSGFNHGLLLQCCNRRFHSKLHAKALPDDAVAITAARHIALRKSQTVGAKIVADPDTGAPVEIWPELPSLTELCAKVCEAIKEEAERRIIAVSPIFRQLNDL